MRYPTLSLGLLAASGLVVVALAALAGSRDSAAVVPFAPGGLLCFEKFDAMDYNPDANVRDSGECDGDGSPSATSDFRTKFCLGWNDDCTALDFPATDANFGNLTGFLPLATVINPSNQYPVGSLAGALSADATIGVLGNPCNLPIAVNFSLMNASTDISNTIFTGAIGQPDPMYLLAYDGNLNGLPDGADRYPSFLRSAFDVDHNFGPDGVPNTFITPTSDDTNGPIPPLQPIVRLFGATKILGGWTTLNFLIFAPGVTVIGPDRTPVQLNPDLGYPTAVVLQDPTVPPAPAPVSDFCAPLRVRYVTFGLTHDNPCTGGLDTTSTRANCPSEQNSAFENTGYPMLPCESASNVDEDQDAKVDDGCPQVNSVAESGAECDDSISNDPEDSAVNDGCPQVGVVGEHFYIGSGCTAVNEGSCVARQNPSQSGTAPAVVYARSLRDADGDGIENNLDVCSLKANPGWNPRGNEFTNDPDNDGLPTACDPKPNDNCPVGKVPPCSPHSPAGCQLGIVGPDYDQDCYSNRQDNCPTANQLKDPTRPPTYTPGFPQPTDNTPQLLDRDGDAIGDACDVSACFEKPGYTFADCQLFGTSLKGTAPDGIGSQDGDYATDCMTFMSTVGVGAPPKADGPFHNPDPNCAFFVATPIPTSSPTPAPTPSSPPLPPGFHDARAARISASHSVNLSGTGTGRVTFTVVNDGNHFESIGVYLDIVPPADGNCFPAGRLSQTVLNLNPGDRRTLTVDGYPGDPTRGDGKVTFGCAQPLAAEGQNYALILAVDAHADDLAFCPPNALISAGCLAHRNDDDADGTDNTRIRTSPTVVIH